MLDASKQKQWQIYPPRRTSKRNKTQHPLDGPSITTAPQQNNTSIPPS